jgi:hypothetical protein
MKRLWVLIFALALSGAATAGEWHIETVDPDWGIEPSLALDSSGYPHIAYRGTGASCLKYARWDGDEWQIETVDTFSDVGVGASLALDSSDFPHISFYDGDDDTLKYAHWNGADWQIETVDSVSDESMWTSLALDSNEYPHIAYVDYKNNHPMYAHWNGAAWQHETIDTSNWVYGYISLTLDSSGHPHVSYSSDSPRGLIYAYKDGTWEIESVTSIGGFSYLVLDSSDYPHISYYHYNFEDLRYASWDGANWRIETVDSSEQAGMYTSLALDSSGYPHISYYDYLNRDLKYARWNGMCWQIETVDSDGNLGEYFISLALDSVCNPHIAYYDKTNGVIKYAYREGVPGPDVSAEVNEDGLLIGWEILGDTPAEFRIQRSAGEDEPADVSGPLSGEAVRWLDRGVDAGVSYRYWLEVVEEDGTVNYFGPTEAAVFRGPAREIVLSVYPSPTSGAFTVECTLPDDGRVTISLYDLSGRRVATVYEGETAAGRQAFSFNAAMLTPGVYLVHLDADAGTLTRRVVITR